MLIPYLLVHISSISGWIAFKTIFLKKEKNLFLVGPLHDHLLIFGTRGFAVARPGAAAAAVVDGDDLVGPAADL
jgi:hypothetical protein